MLTSIAVGLSLSVLTIAIHAVGTTWWLRHLTSQAPNAPTAIPFVAQLRILCSTAVVLLCLHIVEVVVWAIAYLPVDSKEVQTFEESVYFSMVTFAALGYGDIVLDGPWRLMSAIQSMTGLLAFGWSAALLFAVVQAIWKSSLPTPAKLPEESGSANEDL